jgi:ABC-type lipopolysaccharide export system ATPase subunit
MEKIKFQFDDETVEFFVIEETKINGMNYILVTEEEEGDAQALILKDLSAEEDIEAIYEIVEDDNELEYVSKIFSEILDDIEIQK